MGIPLAVLPPHIKASLDLPFALEIAIAADGVLNIFGARAAHIMAHIEARSGVQRVRLAPGPDLSDCGGERRVSVLGAVRPLLEAHRLLHVALHGGEPERLTAKLLLPCRLAEVVIGKAGETVREISRLSGAALAFDEQLACVPEAAGVAERLLRASGDMAQVSNALAQVLLLRMDFDATEPAAPSCEATAAPRDEPGGGHEEYDPFNPRVGHATATGGAHSSAGAGLGAGLVYGAGPEAASLVSSNSQASLGVELLVPNAGAGALIGRGGHTVQRVCKVTGAHSNPDPDPDPDPNPDHDPSQVTGARVFVRKDPRLIAGTPERCVVVRGTLAQVEAAECMLAELLLEAARNGQLPANPTSNPNPDSNPDQGKALQSHKP